MKRFPITLIAISVLAACSSPKNHVSTTNHHKVESGSSTLLDTPNKQQDTTNIGTIAEEPATPESTHTHTTPPPPVPAAPSIMPETPTVPSIEKNKVELSKGFEPQGVFAQTANTNDVSGTNEKQVEYTFSYVSGKLLQVKDGVFTDIALAPQQIDLNQLKIGEHTITLYSAEDIKAARTTSVRDNYEIKSIMNENKEEIGKIGSLPLSYAKWNFRQMRYGYVTQDGKTTLFVQGHLTPETEEKAKKVRSPFSFQYYGQTILTDEDDPNSTQPHPKIKEGEELKEPMPTAGVYQYKGFAFSSHENGYQQNTITAMADFENKKVKVNITQGEGEALVLGGKIHGNTFEGTYNNMYTKGGFYGREARELGGFFMDTAEKSKHLHGVFGATMDPCGNNKCPNAKVPEATLADFEVTE